jgi:hypothetical protein
LAAEFYPICSADAAVEVKGIAAPVPAWQVLRPSGVESRFEALRGAALTPLVGRDEEIELLLRRWARAKAGDGQSCWSPANPASASTPAPSGAPPQPAYGGYQQPGYGATPQPGYGGYLQR